MIFITQKFLKYMKSHLLQLLTGLKVNCLVTVLKTALSMFYDYYNNITVHYIAAGH